jgi:branched-chain amino acid transport system substrate-binding protein
MERKRLIIGVMLAVICLWSLGTQNVRAAEPIVIGVATSLGSLEGKESIKAVQLAVDEINAAGGVKVGGGTRPFKVESIDLRDSDPGVPVPEALLGLEKIILEKKPTALLVGPFRSEALIAGMDILSKYKNQGRPAKVQVRLQDVLECRAPGQVPLGNHGSDQQAVRV